MFSEIIRWLLLRCDPEKAHAIAQQLIRFRYSSCVASRAIQKPVQLFNLTFPNPVGLAAGWDKDALCFDALFRMGFGFVEVGTVTPKAQQGNPKPRLFRIPEKQALINRMGFNNLGLDAFVEKIKTRKASGILGVNIGKNKDTPLEKAIDDYQICLKSVYLYADYIVVNISSPNTPGLRELQSEQYLKNLLQDLQKTRKGLAARDNHDVPLLIKTTVDFPSEKYAEFVQTLMDFGVDGVVISNTTLDHSSVTNCLYGDESGGLSGAPLRVRATQMINAIHTMSEKKLPIIGVGGILSGADAKAHCDAGASLVQLFTGFVYRGPKLIDEILQIIA